VRSVSDVCVCVCVCVEVRGATEGAANHQREAAATRAVPGQQPRRPAAQDQDQGDRSPGQDFRVPPNRSHFYFSLTIDAYETTT